MNKNLFWIRLTELLWNFHMYTWNMHWYISVSYKLYIIIALSVAIESQHNRSVCFTSLCHSFTLICKVFKGKKTNQHIIWSTILLLFLCLTFLSAWLYYRKEEEGPMPGMVNLLTWLTIPGIKIFLIINFHFINLLQTHRLAQLVLRGTLDGTIACNK